jgi:methionyl-tRNA formyltransferase
MRVVFFGTPEFAVPSLRALLRRRIDVAAVVTQPDKPQGRSRSTLVPPPVKIVAEDAGLTVLQPERPTGDLFVAGLRHLRADLGIVIAYGHILRPDVLAAPAHGMINVHASLLPRWRGAAPIPWSILAGDTETGITIMQMEKGLDSGPMLQRATTPIGPEETGGALADRLADLGAATLIATLDCMMKGETITPEPQNPALATYAPKVDRSTTQLAFTNGAEVVARTIRAFDPTPGAWTTIGGTPVKLFGARPLATSGEPGRVLEADRTLVVGCGADAVEVREVQPAGKARMSVAAWVRGRGVRAGDCLG